MMSRDEHLRWAKDRALRYVDGGELGYALSSLASDLGKHEETASLARPELMMLGMGEASTAAGMRRFIEGFN